MKYRVWRSLDRPSSFFGIRGRFSMVFLAVAGAGLVLALAVGSCTNSLVGMLTFAVACIGDYTLVTNLQGRMTERGLARKGASRKIPRNVRLSPRPFLSRFKPDTLWK